MFCSPISRTWAAYRRCGRFRPPPKLQEFAWRRMLAKDPSAGLPGCPEKPAGPNFLAQEICGFVDAGEKNRVWEDLMGFPAMRMVAGRYPLPTKAGLGVDINEEALKRYPFQGTRPFAMAFQEDGAVASI